jgi:hypothetical protein
VIECFVVQSAERARVSLRRYHSNVDAPALPCPGPYAYHNAEGPVLGEFAQKFGHPVHRVWHWPDGAPREIDHADPRWPVKCDACEYSFTPEDQWQVFTIHLYTDAKGGVHTLSERTPGMMWSVPWYYDPLDPEDVAERPVRAQKGHSLLGANYWADWSDKRAPLSVICPGGSEWCVDAQSSNNDGIGWKVTGAAPLLSCSPSIVVPGYHGWLGVNGAPPGWFSNAI